jgi:FkbM family methyltransferase
MPFYSQFKQDSWLEENVFRGFKNGTFMDVGAHDGKTINNTLYFEETYGWTGVNIEPLNDVFARLLVNRPKCINLNYAISSRNGTAEFIMNRGYTEMLSGLKDQYDPRHFQRVKGEILYCGGSTDVIIVNTKRIDTICEENKINHIHYLSIDVEGAEYDVIKSINFNKVFVDVIEFENNYTDTSTPIVEYLSSNGYVVIHKNLDIFMIHRSSQFADPFKSLM